MLYTHFNTLAGIIWLSGAAWIKLCHVLVLLGMTNPNSKNHSSRHLPLNNTFCSNLNLSIGSAELKLISRDTARHFRIFLGTLASCSTSGTDLCRNDSIVDTQRSYHLSQIVQVMKHLQIFVALPQYFTTISIS